MFLFALKEAIDRCMKLLTPLALGFATVFTLAGCAFAPGQHMERGGLLDSGNGENSTVEIITITPKLLAVQMASTPTEQIPLNLVDYKPGPYRIGAGDVLQVTVWEHPELTIPSGTQQQAEANGRIVQADGTLFYPYVGSIQATGKTLTELREFLTQRLAQWIEKPQVDVGVMRFNSGKIRVSGAFVVTTEQVITQTPLNLLAALGAANIKTAEADLTGFTLKRDGQDYHLDLDTLNRGTNLLGSIYLKPGDQLNLPYNDRRKAYVMGEVTRPSSIVFKNRSLTLSDALGTAGGIRQETADGNAIYVIRGVPDLEKKPVQVFQLEAKSPAAMALASQFEVLPQDVVFVGPAGITRWNRFISQLLPSASLLQSGVYTGVNAR